jgi:hypothetical protein
MTGTGRFDSLPLAEVFRLAASRMRDAAPIIRALHGYAHVNLSCDLSELAEVIAQVSQEAARMEIEYDTAVRQ